MFGKLNREEIETVLTENVLGRIGCNDGTKTYVVPVSYAYDGVSIIAHSVLGMKIEMMRTNPAVCFEVDKMKSFTNWKSVIAWGEYKELTDGLERHNAMKFFVNKMMHKQISETAVVPEILEPFVHNQPSSILEAIVYRILIKEKTGRFEND
jgi:uncharacterized protein